MTQRVINDAGLALIEEFEGLSLTAYQDPSGTWTIGYGHTGGVTPGETITLNQARQLLAADILTSEIVVQDSASFSTDNQFAAMVSLAFNIGARAFNSSTVLREHVAGNLLAAAKAFEMWDKAHINGVLVDVPGLLRRRFAEAELYLTP